MSVQEKVRAVLAAHRHDRERGVCTCDDAVQVGLRCDRQSFEDHLAEMLVTELEGFVLPTRAGERFSAIDVTGERVTLVTVVKGSGWPVYVREDNGAEIIGAWALDARYWSGHRTEDPVGFTGLVGKEWR